MRRCHARDREHTIRRARGRDRICERCISSPDRYQLLVFVVILFGHRLREALAGDFEREAGAARGHLELQHRRQARFVDFQTPCPCRRRSCRPPRRSSSRPPARRPARPSPPCGRRRGGTRGGRRPGYSSWQISSICSSSTCSPTPTSTKFRRGRRPAAISFATCAGVGRHVVGVVKLAVGDDDRQPAPRTVGDLFADVGDVVAQHRQHHRALAVETAGREICSSLACAPVRSPTTSISRAAARRPVRDAQHAVAILARQVFEHPPHLRLDLVPHRPPSFARMPRGPYSSSMLAEPSM